MIPTQKSEGHLLGHLSISKDEEKKTIKYLPKVFKSNSSSSTENLSHEQRIYVRWHPGSSFAKDFVAVIFFLFACDFCVLFWLAVSVDKNDTEMRKSGRGTLHIYKCTKPNLKMHACIFFSFE